ncbi:MAG TPA: hypothetical protein VMQ17_28560 [Candidatus Sulfotelmatobacter sp.]|nr:hypothetical protein [Candidatus Sulfotelmatobacter sp.]
MQRDPAPQIQNPLCSICDKHVQLETSKTDEAGRAVHEDCYTLKLQLLIATSPE